MCGRFSLTAALDRLLPRLGGQLPHGLADHYAPRPLVQPGEPVLALRQEHGQVSAALLLWGLVPEWSPDPLGRHGPGQRPFNARAETVAEKASFRGAWRHRRCLLPADGFYERGRLIRRRDRSLFWLAGLWDRWIGPDGSELESCCVLTTAPNALVAPLHPRMPALIPEGLEEAWLAPADGPGLRVLQPLLAGWDPAGWEVVEREGRGGRQLALPL
jgi:putative SOS response-associated peptidase YedK